MILKSQHKTSLTILLIVLFIGQGCVRNATVMPSLTPSTTTITPTATKSMTPTALRTSTLTPRPIVIRTPTPNDVATLNSIETASINTVNSTVQPVVLASYPSPDGKWRAEVIRYDCINYPYPDYTAIIAYEQLKLINLIDATEKTIEDQLQNYDGIGGGGLKGLYWSPNNRYFYYTDWREGIQKVVEIT
jgi:hypothetical protein